MRTLISFTAGILVAAAPLASAGERIIAKATAPEPLPAEIVEVETVQDPPAFRRKKPFHNRGTPTTVTLPDGCTITVIDKHGFPTSSVKPFVVNNTRYEPRVRDIRYVPNSINLPTGKDYGAREQLPVIHDYSGGFFIVPNTPPYR
jgi:hypothetical protein